jgi:hypothetical protein
MQELLRLRNFTLGKKLSDEDVVGSGGLERIAELISCLVPFVSHASLTVSSRVMIFLPDRGLEETRCGVSVLEGFLSGCM